MILSWPGYPSEGFGPENVAESNAMRADCFLTKSEISATYFLIGGISPRLAGRRARRAVAVWTSWLDHNRDANQDEGANFFIPIARNLLKSPDSKK
jgi:hypothetical protein